MHFEELVLISSTIAATELFFERRQRASTWSLLRPTVLPGLGRRYRSSSRRTLNPLGQMPALSVEFNFTVPLQILLCVPNLVFPFLAEMHATDNAVHKSGTVEPWRIKLEYPATRAQTTTHPPLRLLPYQGRKSRGRPSADG